MLWALGTLLASLLLFQAWATVAASRHAAAYSEAVKNRAVAATFAMRLGRFTERGEDADINRMLSEISALNPAVRAYVINERGSVEFAPPGYGPVALPVLDLKPVRAFIAAPDSPTLILGDDPHNLRGSVPVSVAPLRLKGDGHYVYVALAPAPAASSTLLGSIALGGGVLLGSLLFVALAGGSLLVAAHRREEGIKGTIVALSHDLRAPLSAIQGYLETIMHRGSRINDDERARFVSVALQSTRSATGLVNDLHHIAALESSGEPVSMEPVSIVDLAMDSLMGAKPSAEAKGIELHWSIPAGVPIVHGNTALLERMMRNLLENAVRYTPKGGRVEVSMSLLPKTVQVVVADSGVGIPQGELSQVPQKFFRASNIRGTSKGTGIGLSICATIARIHGKELRILSREREGTAVIFELARTGELPGQEGEAA